MKKFLLENKIFLLILFFILVLRIFFIRPVVVKGHSMDPNFSNNDVLISIEHIPLKRFDVVITKEPGSKDSIVKRVIGLPEDLIKEKNDSLYVNGKTVSEPYLSEYVKLLKNNKLSSRYTFDKNFQFLVENTDRFTSDFGVTVPNNSYFLLGDNRLISKDSRMFGSVKKSDVMGKVFLRIYPLNKIKLFL